MKGRVWVKAGALGAGDVPRGVLALPARRWLAQAAAEAHSTEMLFSGGLSGP